MRGGIENRIVKYMCTDSLLVRPPKLCVRALEEEEGGVEGEISVERRSR